DFMRQATVHYDATNLDRSERAVRPDLLQRDRRPVARVDPHHLLTARAADDGTHPIRDTAPLPHRFPDRSECRTQAFLNAKRGADRSRPLAAPRSLGPEGVVRRRVRMLF